MGYKDPEKRKAKMRELMKRRRERAKEEKPLEVTPPPAPAPSKPKKKPALAPAIPEPKPAPAHPKPAPSVAPGPCDVCGGRNFYRIDGEGWFCGTCHPQGDKNALTPPPKMEKKPETPHEFTAAEEFWQAFKVPNTWEKYKYREQEGYPCANGLGRCCLPLIWGKEGPIHNCLYHIERCIYFRRNNQAAMDLEGSNKKEVFSWEGKASSPN